MFSKKLSYRHNRKAKLTRFKRDNRCNENQSLKLETPETVENRDTSNSAPLIRRPDIVEFSEACQLAAESHSFSSLELPSKLRPVKTSSTVPETNCDPSSSEENVVVNLSKLSTLVSGFSHTCKNPKAKVIVDKRQGLCILFSDWVCKLQPSRD